MAMKELDPAGLGRVSIEVLKEKILNHGSDNLNMVSFLILNTWFLYFLLVIMDLCDLIGYFMWWGRWRYDEYGWRDDFYFLKIWWVYNKYKWRWLISQWKTGMLRASSVASELLSSTSSSTPRSRTAPILTSLNQYALLYLVPGGHWLWVISPDRQSQHLCVSDAI